jgi:hypothetical protein
LRDGAISDNGVDLANAPHVIRFHAAWSRDVSQPCVGDRQAVRPPATTVKDFVPDVRFELRFVVVGIIAAICAARMFFDDPRFAPDTDRTADVPVFAALAQGKHVVASIKAAN